MKGGGGTAEYPRFNGQNRGGGREMVGQVHSLRMLAGKRAERGRLLSEATGSPAEPSIVGVKARGGG